MGFARNCNTMGRDHIISVRFDEFELEILDRLAKAIGRNRSDTIRLCVLFVDVYLARGLTLAEIIKPLPEVMEYIEQKLKEEKDQSDLNRK